MNIIYMHTHDSGRYIQPYGFNIPTPNLLNLAKESTLFRHCYSAAPVCSASRASLLTGTWPHVNGMIGLAHRGFTLNDYSMHLSKYLAAHDYETALAGAQHEDVHPENLGYQRILKNEKQPDTENTDSVTRDLHSAKIAVEYLEEKALKKDKFFLSFGMTNTHRKYPDHKGRVDDAYVQPPFPLYDTRANREDMADYMTSASVVDQCAGIVIDTLAKTGLDKNTLVIFTTDHGIAFPNMKCSLYDTGIGVSLIVRYPGNSAAGKATDALVSQIDLFPTICELCGLPIPQWTRGKSLKPVLENPDASVNKAIFAEVTYHAAYEPMRCVRTDRYKLIRHFDFHNQRPPSNTDDGLSKRFVMEAGFFKHPIPREQLFDLWLDPVERINLINDPEYQNTYKELSLLLWDWMEKTDDPLLKHPYRVPAPAGAVVNTLSCLQPQKQELE
ncbi:MAG: sulfatase [Treponema sp.]|nr:sulfatase [Treponema sp.]